MSESERDHWERVHRTNIATDLYMSLKDDPVLGDITTGQIEGEDFVIRIQLVVRKSQQSE